MSGIIMFLRAQKMDHTLLKHMQQLMQMGSGGDMWSSNSLVSELVMAHFIRLEDPSAWMQAGHDAHSYNQDVQSMIAALESNPTMCELLESLWSAHFDIASNINSASFRLMLTSFNTVHPKFIIGCAKYLTAVLPPGWSLHLDLDSRFLKVQAAIATYLGAVENLPLDAGHWHELWVAGDEVAVCLIEHFLMHEDQKDDRWNTEHVRNPAKYLNRNLQNLRDLVAGNTEVCDMLVTLRVVRPDIWAYIDGRAMQRIATCLRGEELLLGCANFLNQSLGHHWQEGRINPRAEVQRCIDAYVNNMFRLYGQQSEGRISPAWQPAPGYVSPAATPRPSRPSSSSGSQPMQTLSFHSTNPTTSPPFSNSLTTSTAEQFSAPRFHAPHTHTAGSRRRTAPHTAMPTNHGPARHTTRHTLTLGIPNGQLSSRAFQHSPSTSAAPLSFPQMSPPSPNVYPLSPNRLSPQMHCHNESCPDSPISASSFATVNSSSSHIYSTNVACDTGSLGAFSSTFTCPPSPTSSASSHRTSGSEILDMWQTQQSGSSKRSIWSPSHLTSLTTSFGTDNDTRTQAQDWSDRLGGLWDASYAASTIPQIIY